MKKSISGLVVLLLIFCCFVVLCSCLPEGENQNQEPKGNEETVTEYAVNFYVEGTLYKTITVNDIASITLPANPTKIGYTFVRWYTDEACTIEFDKNFFTTTETTFKLYAKFTETLEGKRLASSLTLQERWLSQSSLVDTVFTGIVEDEKKLTAITEYKFRTLACGTVINYLDTGDGYLAVEFPNKVAESTLKELLGEGLGPYSIIPETNIYVSDYMSMWNFLTGDIHKVGEDYYSLDNSQLIRVNSNNVSYNILNGTIKIGSFAFGNYRELTSITIPSSVSSIGDNSFFNCSRITTINIPDSVTSIGNAAFSGCSGLTSMTLPFIGSLANATTASASTLFGYIFGTLPYSGGAKTKQYYQSDKPATLYYIPTSLSKVTIMGGIKLYYGAFSGCTGLTNITIPAGVTNIGSCAFSGCSALTSITIPAGVTSIGDYALSGCTGLTSITIPAGVTSIGYYAFSGCSGLTSIIVNVNNTTYRSEGNCLIIISTNTLFLGCKNSVIPTSVTSIGDYAFSGCSGLTSITIPEGMTNIESNAFLGCSGLTSITIPESVTSIGSYAFSGCSALTSISIPDSVKSIGFSAFSGCNNLSYENNNNLNYLGNWLIDAKDKALTSAVLKETTIGISYSAFFECNKLISITIPNSVDYIGSYAFYGCSGLTSITIPDSVTSIGDYAFYGCSGLTAVTIPNSVTSIGRYAFADCVGIADITIPDSVISIGSAAFQNNIGIISMTIGSGVMNVDSFAFFGCKRLIEVYNRSSLSIVAGEYSIGYLAFYAKNVYTPSVGYSKLSTDADGYVLYTNDATVTLVKYIGTSTDLTVPNNVTSIGDYAFYNCSSLTSITIFNSVSSIAEGAFFGCSGLTSMTLPFVGGSLNATTASASTLFGYIFGTLPYSGGTKTIQNYANINATLTYYIPNSLSSVTIIGCNKLYYGAFYGCSGLTSVIIPDSVVSIGISAFEGCNDSIYNIYNSNLKYIGNWLVGTTNKTLISATLKDATIGIADNAFLGCNKLISITIPAGVTSIGSYAFSGCSGLTSVIIPDSVVSIGISAFEGCNDSIYNIYNSNLKYIGNWLVGTTNKTLISATLKDATIGIADNAFLGCNKLISITIPDSVKRIGDYAFYGCSALTSIAIPNSVKRIGNAAFSRCIGLTNMTLPFVGGSLNATTASDSTLFGYIFGKLSYTGGTETTQNYANIDATLIYYIPNSLHSVTITGGNNLYYGAFSGCSGLTSITIPESVTSIGSYAFYGCSGLTSITIPEGMTNIESNAFLGCSGLNSIMVNVNNTKYRSEDNCLIIIATSTLILGCKNSVIPTNITNIGDNAFYGCSGLTSITIPDSVTIIGNSAFYGCSSLTAIIIPDSVTSIGNSAFYGCRDLASVSFSTTSGWYVTNNATATYGTSMTVTDANVNANNIKNYYESYYWKRNP